MNRRVALLSAVMVLGALPLGAQEVEYAAGTTRYRVSTTTKGTQSTPMGNSGFELGMQQEITLNLARQSKDTMLATVTLDSIALTGAGDRRRGQRAAGSQVRVAGLSHRSRLLHAGPANENPLASQIAEGITRFLPAYRAQPEDGRHVGRHNGGKGDAAGDGARSNDRVELHRRARHDDRRREGVQGRPRDIGEAAGSGRAQGTPVSMESLGHVATAPSS